MKRPSFDIDIHSSRLSTTFYEELTNSEEGLGGESVSVVFATDDNVDRSVDTFTDSIQIAPQEEEGCMSHPFLTSSSKADEDHAPYLSFTSPAIDLKGTFLRYKHWYPRWGTCLKTTQGWIAGGGVNETAGYRSE